MVVRIAGIGWVLAGIAIPVLTFFAILGSQGADETNVVLAAEDIPAGTTITVSMLVTAHEIVRDVPANAYEQVSEVVGQVARASVLRGQLITTDVFTAAPQGPTAAPRQADPVGEAIDAAAVGLVVLSLPSFLLAWLIGARRRHGAAAIGSLLAPCMILLALWGTLSEVLPWVLLLALVLMLVSVAAWKSTTAVPRPTESPAADLG